MATASLGTGLSVMPKIKRKKPPRHILVPDTNILWHREKDVVASPDFESFWRENGQKYDIELVLPEVVHGELLYQHTTSARMALERANKQFQGLSSIAAKVYGHRVTDARVLADVRRKIEGWIASLGGRVEATPVATIDWHRLIQDSLWRRPPFLEAKNSERDSEKGFRDSMILETVCALAAGSPSPNAAFVTSDQILLSAAKQRTGKTCACYETLDEFASYLRLLDEALTDEFIRAIQLRARAKFFSKGDESCLFIRDDVSRTIREQFSEQLSIPKSPIGQLSLGLIGRHIKSPDVW